jgi:hypothetical protein
MVLGLYEGLREKAAQAVGASRDFFMSELRLRPLKGGAAIPGFGKKLKSKRDPSWRKALLRMTAKCGLGGRTGRLGEAVV